MVVYIDTLRQNGQVIFEEERQAELQTTIEPNWRAMIAAMNGKPAEYSAHWSGTQPDPAMCWTLVPDQAVCWMYSERDLPHVFVTGSVYTPFVENGELCWKLNGTVGDWARFHPGLYTPEYIAVAAIPCVRPAVWMRAYGRDAFSRTNFCVFRDGVAAVPDKFVVGRDSINTFGSSPEHRYMAAEFANAVFE